MEVKKDHSFSITSQPSGGGSISLDPPGGSYEEGTEVTVATEPAGGYKFDRWSGDFSGNSKTGTVTVNSDMKITTYFTEAGKGELGEEESGGLPLI